MKSKKTADEQFSESKLIFWFSSLIYYLFYFFAKMIKRVKEITWLKAEGDREDMLTLETEPRVEAFVNKSLY